MKMSGFILTYIKQKRMTIAVFLLFAVIFFSTFALYRLPLEAVLYPVLLCAGCGLLFAGLEIRKQRRLHMRLMEYVRLTETAHDRARLIEQDMDALPYAATVPEQDYQELLRALAREQRQEKLHLEQRYQDMIEYYTVWAHQVKTPIASMRLNLQNEDSELSRLVLEDLVRIEQYVEMVLCYLRLDSDSTDYVIKQYDLDELVRQSVRKLSGQFIRRRLSLVYEPLEQTVITDAKWLSFVIEQVLLNALKYTPSGSITIRLEEPATLCICDTGIGIAAEDLPRIFEKGYTGYNGRGNKQSSGIGLYLCRRICRKLGHEITAESVPHQGTVIRIRLEQPKLRTE